MKTSPATLSAALAFVGSVSAFWRMPCRFQTGIGRIDPIVDPGAVSAHVHTITGSSGFSPTADFESLTADGTCTACSVTQDHSAYWTPPLYFQYSNGTTVMVPQVGGMLAYYLYYLDNVKAFPEGFQMLAGYKSRRNFTGPDIDEPLSSWKADATDNQYFLQQRALGFNCLNGDLNAPEPSLYRHELPSKEYMDEHCTWGLRLELAFPSCGNGDLDSADHQSHMAYPSLVKQGNCPDGYDVHYPFLFYETIFATNAFAGGDGEFVLSYGDPVGTGYHGDFIMGWESEEFLQTALDTCQDPSGDIENCPLFDIDEDAASKCKFDMPSNLKNDDPIGPCEGLPVDVPIQYGPEEATNYPVAGQNSKPTTGLEPTAAPSTFSHATVTYSPADPESTKSAQGGIIVAKYSSGADAAIVAEATTSPAAPYAAEGASSWGPSPAQVTPVPAAPDKDGDCIATSWITRGNTVIEVFVTEVDVTVTATETAPADAHWKRHLHRHRHHANF
ncbi:hypothetical protein LTR37_018004 [Vermiconidia calcicola]|uniref:Uncharacterized protein n=1 Tax=Vermiconidia calcicola TaxID=1690605 RepID=A0ACC3MIH2_9PEZI|nr:hypothetical protein LTR37_018004 [Vermiconidia calcicola]